MPEQNFQPEKQKDLFTEFNFKLAGAEKVGQLSDALDFAIDHATELKQRGLEFSGALRMIAGFAFTKAELKPLNPGDPEIDDITRQAFLNYGTMIDGKRLDLEIKSKTSK